MKNSITNSVTKKMFVVTVGVILVFLTVMLLAQRNLFETMYNKQKETDIKNNVVKFSKAFVTAKDDSEILGYIENFESYYNTSIAVLNTDNGILIQFKTNSDVVDSRNSNVINYVIKEINSDKQALERLNSGDEVTFNFTDTLGDINYIASSVKQGKYMIIGFTSLQQITEAARVIGMFYKYFFFGAVVVAVILAFVYSKFITKPLRTINGVAVKLSNLDFSEKCSVKNNDEIGNLAATLNFLSDNLDSALTSLNEANKKLQADIDKERRIEVMRKEFIADVSHELKTPITLIKGYAEGIKDGIFLEGSMENSLDVIVDESDKMSKLVKDMLQLSSLESGKEKLNREVFDLSYVVNKVVVKLSHSIDEKNLSINMKLKSAEVDADAFKIEQVVTNFMTNAIKHTPEGGNIYINMELSLGDVLVSFENEGSIIDSDDIDKLWDQFYKVDKSRNRKDGGTGLGLSIVKNILDLHGGSYSVENTKIGVKFTFTLKLKDDQ